MAGGKSGGSISHENELGDMLFNQFKLGGQKRDRGMIRANPMGGPMYADIYNRITGGMPRSMGVSEFAPTTIYGATPYRYGETQNRPQPAPSQQRGYIQGGGAMTAMPTGASGMQFAPGGGRPTSGGKGGSQPQSKGMTSFAPNSGQMGSYGPGSQNGLLQEQVQPLAVPSQLYGNLQQGLRENIQRGSNVAQQDLFRGMANRGLGRSGIAMKAAGDLYNRGAGEQLASGMRDLANERMKTEFGEAQTARGLDLDRQKSLMQGLLGLGQLGIGERGQTTQEIQQSMGGENSLMQGLAGLGQSMISAKAQGGKGK